MSSLRLKMNDETDEVSEIDESIWPRLGEKMELVLEGRYVSAQTILDAGNRRGRSSSDIPASLDILSTVQNRITSLCKNLIQNLERRLEGRSNPESN